MLEFVDSDVYFVQAKNNFINPVLQVGSGSGSGSVKKSTGSGGPKITGSESGSSSLIKTGSDQVLTSNISSNIY